MSNVQITVNPIRNGRFECVSWGGGGCFHKNWFRQDRTPKSGRVKVCSKFYENCKCGLPILRNDITAENNGSQSCSFSQLFNDHSPNVIKSCNTSFHFSEILPLLWLCIKSCKRYWNFERISSVFQRLLEKAWKHSPCRVNDFIHHS